MYTETTFWKIGWIRTKLELGWWESDTDFTVYICSGWNGDCHFLVCGLYIDIGYISHEGTCWSSYYYDCEDDGDGDEYKVEQDCDCHGGLRVVQRRLNLRAQQVLLQLLRLLRMLGVLWRFQSLGCVWLAVCFWVVWYELLYRVDLDSLYPFRSESFGRSHLFSYPFIESFSSASPRASADPSNYHPLRHHPHHRATLPLQAKHKLLKTTQHCPDINLGLVNSSFSCLFKEALFWFGYSSRRGEKMRIWNTSLNPA